MYIKEIILENEEMQVGKRNIFLLMLLLTFLTFGCTPSRGPLEVVLPPSVDDQQSEAVAKRFQNSSIQGRTAVESAIELSEKYAKLSEQAAELRDKNKDLTDENTKLKEQIDTLKADLQQTKKELTEANDLLVEMLTELNNWKASILGFRDEMREAEKAQLEALLKILEILGGEVPTESVQQQEGPKVDMQPEQSTQSEVSKEQKADEQNE
jgi:chromosome segregation ATPase